MGRGFVKILVMGLVAFVNVMYWLIIYIKLYHGNLFYSSQMALLFWFPCILVLVGIFVAIRKLFQYQELQDHINFMTSMNDLRERQKSNIEMSILNDQYKQEQNIQELKEILDLLENNHYEEAKSKFKHFHQQSQYSEYIQYCDNTYINAILYNKIAIAKELNITINYDILLPKNDDLDIIDLPTIIFNLLDNAIEASQKAENKYISLRIRYSDKYISIYQKNANTEKMKEEISGLRGYGLKIIEEVVNKYDGYCEWQDNHTDFESRIMIKYKKGDFTYENSDC